MNQSIKIDNNFKITDSSVKRLKFLLQKKPQGSFFRIEVKSGGCSGMRYIFDFDTKFDQDEDVKFDFDSVNVVIDKYSLEYLNSSVLDFKEELGGSHFAIQNPNAQSNCGCGSSFSV
jgi:iron-sulfur cluster insertion protein